MKISESQLRSIIRNILNERYYSNPDDYDTPDVISHVTFYFDPQTLEILSDDENNENVVFLELRSNDFPNAWSSYDPGDYWREPSSDGDTGECGGHYEIFDSWVPEQFQANEKEIINNFLKTHHEEIIDGLTNNAEFE